VEAIINLVEIVHFYDEVRDNLEAREIDWCDSKLEYIAIYSVNNPCP